MTSKIERTIEEIQEFIDHCKNQPLSSTKIVVNKEELDELLDELRARTPEEIKRYQKIISNKEAILADAQAKADSIIAEAQIHTEELVSEHQIMQQAYAQANEIVMVATNQAQEILDKATEDANQIRTAAIDYTDGILSDLENIIGHAVDTTRARSESLLASLEDCYRVVASNRNELNPPAEEPEAEPEAKEEEELPKIELDADMLK